MLRCVSWAKFCFPDNECYSVDFHKKLYAEHRMLCCKHFKESSFTEYAKKKLNRHAVPDVQCVEEVPEHLIEPMSGPSSPKHDIIDAQPGLSHILMDITNVVPVAKEVPNPSQNPIESVPSTSKHEVIEAQPVSKPISASNSAKSKREAELLKS